MKKQDKKAPDVSRKRPCVGCGKALRNENSGYYCVSCQLRHKLIKETEDKPIRDLIQLDYDPFSDLHEGEEVIWQTFQQDFRRTEYIRLQFPPSMDAPSLLRAVDMMVNFIKSKIDKDNLNRLNLNALNRSEKINNQGFQVQND